MTPIRLFAAGSLKTALTEVAQAFASSGGLSIEGRFGPSGLLKDDIVNGAGADVFASANMDHPQALRDAGRSGPVVMFARNEMCALVRPGLQVTGDSLLDAILDPSIKLGTSTPKADPSGDYAFAVFARAEAVRPGARAVLEAKALKLTGARDSPAPPPGHNVYGWHVSEGHADIFITYRTNVMAARDRNPVLQSSALPETLAVGADYGLTVLNDAPPAAHALARFVMSAAGRAILAAHGFSPPPSRTGSQ
ncbi:MAG TPA: molybdate ABC transporter substrate-binding protein [Pseudolabrys sp.]|nr:molybdate ABC transporter substrate-binding protein [Pseudolabrys sp.]